MPGYTEIKTYGTSVKRLKIATALGIPNGAALPAIGSDDYGAGSMFYLTTDEKLYQSNGSVWNAVGGGTGTLFTGNYIIYGSGTWSGVGLIFDITDTSYVILGAHYATLNSAFPTVTLAAADPTLDRIDVIYLDDSNSVGVLTGTPAASPLKPQVDPSSQIELTFVYISAAAVVPTGVTNTVVYDENTESTGATSATGVNFNYGTSSFSGAKNTLVGSWTNGQFLSYLMPVTHLASDVGFVKFYLRLPTALASTAFLSMYFYNGTTPTSNALNITSGLYGFNRSLTGAWQLITIPVANMSLITNVFNKVYFRLNGASTTGLQLDLLYLAVGNNPAVGPPGVTSFNGRTGAVVPVATDYTPAFIGAEAVANKGIAGGYAPLDGSAKVPAANLPSYVDDVLDFANFAAFPGTGETGKIYLADDTNFTYRWTGSAYVVVGSGSSVSAATETVAGIAEIATTAEVAAGTDDGRIVSPLKLAQALVNKVDANGAITGATKTKITYDSKGLVTAGADATTADIADSTNKRYVTDAQLVVIGNTSGVNTGDEILEYANIGAFPGTGVAGVIYMSIATNFLYRWDTGSSTYVQVGGSGTPPVVATAAELNTGTDNAKYASALALEGSKYDNQNKTKIHAVASGTNTYTASLTPAITAYVTGQQFNILFTNANTAASTININGLGAKALQRDATTALSSGDITAGRILTLMYDGTAFQMAGGGAVADATSTVKGILKLTNELGGTAALPTIDNAAVIGKVLTGFSAGPGSQTVTSTDSILQALQKLAGNDTQQSILIITVSAGNNLFNYYNFK